MIERVRQFRLEYYRALASYYEAQKLEVMCQIEILEAGCTPERSQALQEFAERTKAAREAMNTVFAGAV